MFGVLRAELTGTAVCGSVLAGCTCPSSQVCITVAPVFVYSRPHQKLKTQFSPEEGTQELTYGEWCLLHSGRTQATAGSRSQMPGEPGR